MIECRAVLVQRRRAVHTALTAVAERAFAQRSLHGDVYENRASDLSLARGAPSAGRATAAAAACLHGGAARRAASTAPSTTTEFERRSLGHDYAPRKDDAPTESKQLSSGRRRQTSMEADAGTGRDWSSDRWCARPATRWSPARSGAGKLPRVERIILLEHRVDHANRDRYDVRISAGVCPLSRVLVTDVLPSSTFVIRARNPVNRLLRGPFHGVSEHRTDARCHRVELLPVRHLRSRKWQRHIKAITIASRDQVNVIVHHILPRVMT